MKVELKKISFNERMSEETNCFTADLYINGVKVGECQNRGNGGSTDYYSDGKSESKKLIQECEDYCLGLPKIVSEEFKFEYNQTLESVIDDLLETFLKLKETKKMEKKMEKGILFGVPNGHSYQMISWGKNELKNIPLVRLQQSVNRIRMEECKNGVVILNTNLEKLGVI